MTQRYPRRGRLLRCAATLLCAALAAPDAVAQTPSWAAPPPEPAAPGAVAGYLSWAASGLAALPAATREAAWEVSYMFGFNQTPPMRARIVDGAGEPAASQAAAPQRLAALLEASLPVTSLPAALPPAPLSPTTTPVTQTEDVDPALLANFIYDRGTHRPDGSFFVPKTLQRLFNVRVAAVAEADLAPVLRMTGRIVPDPRAHGSVQAGLVGRIEPSEDGLPVLGAHVTKGQLLGYVVPAVGVVDRTQVRREIARLTTEIRVETENLEILKQFRFVPFRDGKIYQSEQRLAGLRRERAALLPLLQTQEALRAPVDGVISVARALAGKLVQAGEVVYEIVSPTELWIEAMAADPAVAAAAGRPVAASAVTPEGQVLSLAYIGSGLALQQQSTPVLFRIDSPPPGLRIGRPVTVIVRGDAPALHGIPVARESVTLGTDGIQEVWEQTEPEIFLPHPVRTRDIDGTTTLVVDGLPAGARVVVRGARLMAQLQ